VSDHNPEQSDPVATAHGDGDSGSGGGGGGGSQATRGSGGSGGSGGDHGKEFDKPDNHLASRNVRNVYHIRGECLDYLL
jgi:hypothetical protein